MKDYSVIRKVHISTSVEITNNLLADEWVLMNVFSENGRPVFVLGLPFSLDLENLSGTAKSDYEDS